MNEVSKQLMCIKMKSGVEIWIEKEKAQRLIDLLGLPESRFVDLEGGVINSASIEGVYPAQFMEDLTRRKNGMWQCHTGYWHDKGQQCGHK